MRVASLTLLVAVLMASPLVHAQRASLADRVAALEARAAGDQNPTELVNQVTQLSAEVQSLRGQIEELQQQLEQARQSQRAQYLDLSGRLDRLEGSGGGAAANTAPSNPAPDGARDDSPAPAPATRPAAPVAAAQGEQGAYDNAFDALKTGDYAEAARRLRDFLAAYPDGALAPNAIYWLGESYYVTQNYQLASAQFRALLDRYPNHDKAPGALLKLGLTQYGLRQYDAADATLRAVMRRYPGTDVARIADDRLRAMQLAGNR